MRSKIAKKLQERQTPESRERVKKMTQDIIDGKIPSPLVSISIRQLRSGIGCQYCEEHKQNCKCNNQ